MMADLENDPFVKLGVTASLVGQYQSDQRTFVNHLASMLERVMPETVNIERGGLLRGKEIRAVRIRVDDQVYSIEVPSKGPPTTKRSKQVHGVVLKSDDIDMADWLREVGDVLEQYAKHNAAARDALQSILEG